MIDSLVSSSTVKMLEQTLNFTEQRHEVLLEDIANVSTPGFVQKDVSVGEFQNSMRQAVEARRASFNNAWAPQSGETVKFAACSSQVVAKPLETVNSVAFHDRGVRNMEYLMGEMADNAMAHNMVAQF